MGRIRRHFPVLFFVFAIGVGEANTIIYTTAPGATAVDSTTGSSLAENANVTFITGANSLEIRVQNMQVGSGSVLQTISGVDWLLSDASTGAAVVDFSGSTISLVSPPSGTKGSPDVTYTSGPAYTPANFPNDRWKLYTTAPSAPNTAGAQITGGMQLTTLSGGNPNETIIGPPLSSGLYAANKGLLGDNPFIQTNNGYVSWTIHFATGVTANTTVTAARLTFNTAFDSASELTLIPDVPEPQSNILIASGIGLVLLSAIARKSRQSRS